jgi:hypothetical protein
VAELMLMFALDPDPDLDIDDLERDFDLRILRVLDRVHRVHRVLVQTPFTDAARKKKHSFIFFLKKK